MRLGRDYDAAPGPYHRTASTGQGYEEIPVLTAAGLYDAFAFQEHDATGNGIIYYALCRPQRPGENGIPCRNPLADDYKCAFNDVVSCGIDVIAFGGSLTALRGCNSIGSCGLAVVGVLGSAVVVGRLTLRAFDAVAARAVVAQGGLDALKADATAATAGQAVSDGEVHTLTADETQAVIKNTVVVQKPGPRHFLTKITAKSQSDTLNTVIDPSVDVNADVADINAGKGVPGENNTVTVNGRTYGMKGTSSRIYPMEGTGFYQLNGATYSALKYYIDKGPQAALYQISRTPPDFKDAVNRPLVEHLYDIYLKYKNS